MRLGRLALLIALATGCSNDGSLEPTCDLEGVPATSCDTAHAMRLTAVPPPSRGNKYADDEGAAYLGFKLFFSTDLGTGVGCPSCHLPELAFTDRKSVSMGKDAGARNAPTVFNAADLNVIFWDGRADSLWSQPLFAIENPLEMASSRLELAHYVATVPEVRSQYEAVFGSLPEVDAWPAAGKPGDPEFDALETETQDEANRLASNVGKSLEAYMRKNRTVDSQFDRYLDGDSTMLIPAAQRGFRVFLEQGCATCHGGPMLTDQAFHDVGFPSLPGAAPDLGRAGGIKVLRDNIFNLSGPYADPGPGVPSSGPADDGLRGAFRTPSLRNITRTEPYGHDGALASLRDVLMLHAPNVDEEGTGELLALFQTLNGDYPDRPWNNWPSPQ